MVSASLVTRTRRGGRPKSGAGASEDAPARQHGASVVVIISIIVIIIIVITIIVTITDIRVLLVGLF